MRLTAVHRWSVWAFLVAPAFAAPAVDSARLHEHAMAQVVPVRGYQSRVVLGDSIVKLAQEGVIDAKKLNALYAPRGGLPEELKGLLTMSAHAPMLLTEKSAPLYVNILWALGLANRMAANDASPLNAPSRSRFASTGGWTLGREAGGAYFNRFPIVALTPQQESLVTRVAQHSFRPCCDNSTFFQDCNHGSALLGLLALGASQGLNEEELFREALAFNSYWFPHQYAHIALYFQAVQGVAWRDIDPRMVMSAKFSSASGWQENVGQELQARGLLPQQGGSNCGV
ncbi:MAG: hypothetical protein A3G26_05950 [Betaproteobacteria bacterium RIFCSPLOWO2_12_FULL_65_110]|nr:MAG: hypothetical protein A3G26_05950 [Betaproteobacteria bacterium RIFCSPLOWO2_12_FULL_65_110]